MWNRTWKETSTTSTTIRESWCVTLLFKKSLQSPFTRSPMQFVNVVFSYLLWLAPCFWKGNVNVFGGDSDDVQLCVNILHQILGLLSRCRVMTSICMVSSENVCEEQHTQVVDSCDAQEAYNKVRELSSFILESLVHCQSYKVMSF